MRFLDLRAKLFVVLFVNLSIDLDAALVFDDINRAMDIVVEGDIVNNFAYLRNVDLDTVLLFGILSSNDNRTETQKEKDQKDDRAYYRDKGVKSGSWKAAIIFMVLSISFFFLLKIAPDYLLLEMFIALLLLFSFIGSLFCLYLFVKSSFTQFTDHQSD